MRILSITSLYPNAAQPNNGIFVENRLRHLQASTEAEVEVIAPVPWFPFAANAFGKYAAFAKAPKVEVRSGITIHHPRYLVIPKVGMSIAPLLMYRALKSKISKLIQAGYDFDIIDAHYFYPDGVAAAMAAKTFDRPITITARGTDINLIPNYALPRMQILKAAEKADALISVCQALNDEMVRLGCASDKIHTLRNGIDLDIFQPVDRDLARKKWGITGRTCISVGHLVERKGNHITIASLPNLPNLTLLIVGEGPEKGRLKKLAQSLGVSGRVKFVGPIPHSKLPELYSAADALILASSREGWANVLLESMACGTPVVATDIWGTGEVVASPEAGVLAYERSAAGIADATNRLFRKLPERTTTRRYAEQFSWDDTTRGQIELFQQILHGN